MAEYIEREAALRDWPPCDDPADAYQFIRNYPAADVRPVVRAEWQSEEQDKPPCKWYSCDYCGFHALCKSNYCPNCGAKMDDNAIQHTECVGNALGALDGGRRIE